KRTDPAIRDLETDAETGDVVKVVRDSRTADQAVVYRLVVD
ncbi:DNA-directed RNA polymerase subunit H, partial [Halobacteriales archaeon QH_8_68_33]